MKCIVCQSEHHSLKDGLYCNACIASSENLAQKLMEVHGVKRGQLLFMGYPASILNHDDETIDILHDTMMHNIENGIH